MNRRELLKRAVALPAALAASGVTATAETHPTGDDLVVVTIPMIVSDETRSRVQAQISDALPGVRVLVLSDGLTLEVHRGVARVEDRAGR